MSPFNGFFNTVKGLASQAVNAFESIGDQSQTFAPLESTKHNRNKRAEAVLRGNVRSASKAPIQSSTKPGYSERTLTSAGIRSDAIRQQGLDGTTTHDISFSRDTPNHTQWHEPPKRNLSPQQRALRQANIQYQQGQLLDEVKVDDVVTAQPITSDSGRNPRARIYDRMTRGALKPAITDYGSSRADGSWEPYEGAEIESRRLPKNKWETIEGDKAKFNPKDLKKKLTQLAAGSMSRRLAGGPVLQGVLAVDQAAKAKFGKGVFENAAERKKETTDKALEYIKQQLGLK